MDMKFYVHTEKPEFTMVVKWNDSDGKQIKDLSEIFLKSIRLKFPDEAKTIDESSVIFRKGNKHLRNTDAVCKVIKTMDDVYAEWESKACEGNEVPKQDERMPIKQTEPPPTVTQTGRSEPPPTLTATEQPDVPYTVANYLELAESLTVQLKLQHALVLYKEVLKQEPTNKQALLGIADAYLKASRPKDALPYLKEAHKLYNLSFRLGQCYVKLGENDRAIEMLMKHCKDLRNKGGTSTVHKQDVQVWLARAYIQKQQSDMAIAVLQGVLRENKKHLEALTEYAPLIYPLGPTQKDEAMTIMLTGLVNKRDDMNVKQKFASLCQQEHGMQVLESMSGPAWRDIPAVVFMATSLRDAGAVKETEMLMRHACNLQPENAHTLLTYVHTLELVDKHSEAVKEIQQFINRWPEKTIGSFKCGMLLSVINCYHGDVYLNDPSDDIMEPSVTVESSSQPYTEETNYLLAVLFTLVKILYVKGALAFIPPIKHFIDPLTEGQDLHHTNIRNEAAYYSCISQLLDVREQVQHVVSHDQYIYFVGDSHCIPPAWQRIEVQGQNRVIHPVLSTGTKIWHLRDESTFYPKFNFNSAIRIIPAGAVTVFCFGEIDCREALLLCVEKAKYDSMEDAMDHIIAIYIKLLLQLKCEHQWDIYVHPVMPVLDLTRSTVMQFNQRLSKKLKSVPELKWLEFVENLLVKNNDELLLKKQYEFDGTHVHPCYLSLVWSSLNKHNTSGS